MAYYDKKSEMSARDKALRGRVEVFYAGLQRRINRNYFESGGNATDEIFRFVKGEVDKVKHREFEPV